MSPPLHTAVVLIDPYNDFLHPNGKVYPAMEASLTHTDSIRHIRDLIAAARSFNIPIYYGLHQPYKPGNFEGWKHMKDSYVTQKEGRIFEEGSWGAQILEGMEPDVSGNRDVVVTKHWSSSSFQNTDLDFQLRQREITNLVIAGMTTNTCVEATARYAYDLGYDVTLLTDATAAFTTELKDVATNIIWPLFAQQVTTVDEWTASLGEK